MLPVGDAPVIAQVPRTADLQAPSLPDVLERATPAVVNIAVLSLSPTESNPLYNDPYFRRFFNLPDLPQQQPRLSAGSGVIVDAVKGYVITNHHVVAQASEIEVTLKDRRRFTGEFVGSDKATDIAVLKIPAENLTALPLGDSGNCGWERAL
jgi:S1-C subfamily serine protease